MYPIVNFVHCYSTEPCSIHPGNCFYNEISYKNLTIPDALIFLENLQSYEVNTQSDLIHSLSVYIFDQPSQALQQNIMISIPNVSHEPGRPGWNPTSVPVEAPISTIKCWERVNYFHSLPPPPPPPVITEY